MKSAGESLSVKKKWYFSLPGSVICEYEKNKWIKGLEVCYNPRKSKTESKIKKTLYSHFFCQEMSELAAWPLRVPPDSAKEKKRKEQLKINWISTYRFVMLLKYLRIGSFLETSHKLKFVRSKFVLCHQSLCRQAKLFVYQNHWKSCLYNQRNTENIIFINTKF